MVCLMYVKYVFKRDLNVDSDNGNYIYIYLLYVSVFHNLSTVDLII